MGLEFSTDFEFVLEDDSYIAVRQAGQVEVWTVDGQVWIGNLQQNATADDVDRVLRIYSRGLDRGYEAGEQGLAGKIRNMLNVN